MRIGILHIAGVFNLFSIVTRMVLVLMFALLHITQFLLFSFKAPFKMLLNIAPSSLRHPSVVQLFIKCDPNGVNFMMKMFH